MTIKEVEQKTGLPRSVIRFYEREGLIAPQRNAQNSYREYEQEDVERLIRIAFLRTLEIPIEDIRRVIAGETTLGEAAGMRYKALCDKEKDVARALVICAQLEEDAPARFDELDVSRYTGEEKDYVAQYRSVLLQDCERFALWFGSDACWMALVIVGTLLASIMFPKLPERIPVQWDDGVVTGTAPRGAIFVFPLLMTAIRFLLRGKLATLCRLYFGAYGDTVAAYAVNGLCLLALCLEAFSVLYVHGAVRHVEAVIVGVGVFVLAIVYAAVRGFGAKSKR